MSSPYHNASQGTGPIVKGVDVSSNYSVQSGHNHVPSIDPNQPMINSNGDVKGQVQPARCNDSLFVFLFFAHLGALVYVAATCAPSMQSGMASVYEDAAGGRRTLGTSLPLGSLWNTCLNYYNGGLNDGEGRMLEEDGGDGDEDFDINISDVMYLLGVTGFLSFIVTGLALPLMMCCAKFLIKFSLLFNVVTPLLTGVAGVLVGETGVAIMGFLFFALMACYAYRVWDRIPFAAANLVTAVSAVRANIGIAFFAYGSLILIIIWSFFWVVAAMSGVYVQMDCDGVECENEANGWLIFVLLVSFFWTHQIIKAHLHTTVAGVVGTWWFNPENGSSCCSSAVRDSFVRSSTFSFGSICFGSLIVAIIQAMREMLHAARSQGDDMLMCCADCLLGCIESIFEYFNSWAFVYVGLYGYGFVDAGKNVINLFQYRGWTTIITDNLVDNVLLMLSGGIGLIMGFIAVLIAQSKQMDFMSGAMPFLIGFILGFTLSSTLMGVVESSVRSVIVCYAEAPAEFQQNHPVLSEEMRVSWQQAWPVDFKY